MTKKSLAIEIKNLLQITLSQRLSDIPGLGHKYQKPSVSVSLYNDGVKVCIYLPKWSNSRVRKVHADIKEFLLPNYPIGCLYLVDKEPNKSRVRFLISLKNINCSLSEYLALKENDALF